MSSHAFFEDRSTGKMREIMITQPAISVTDKRYQMYAETE